MKRILVLYEQIDNTIEVNLTAIKTIFEVGEFTLRFRLSCKATELDLNWCDICYAIRPSSLYSATIAENIKESGRQFISLFDDDLLGLPVFHSSYWRKKYVIKCLRQSIAVVMCNPLLIKDYKTIVEEPKYILSHAFVLEEEIKKPSDCIESIKMVYAAGKDHTDLFEKFIMPALETLMGIYQNLEIHIMGIEPNMHHFPYSDRVIRHATRPLYEYKEFMWNNDFCIGVAPLNNDRFSNRKYFIKYLDYARFGIAGIYSAYMPYTLVIKDHENGLMVENTIENWEMAIRNLIDNSSLRNRIVANSQAHIRSKFSVDEVRNKLYNELRRIIDIPPPKKDISLKYNIISVFIYIQKSYYYRLKMHLITDGFIKTIKKLLVGKR